MPPLEYQLLTVPFKAVALQCLDEEQRPISNAYASGFIRQEGRQYFLYTCWHVATGYDRNDLRIGPKPPGRMFLHVELQAVDRRLPGVETIGGRQSLVIPLYDRTEKPPRPVWYQDDRHVPHPDLNAIGILVPFWHDAIKLALPHDLEISDVQVLEEANRFPLTTLLNPGDKVLIVGYPYGFSALGSGQPTPVVLTRFVAGTKVIGRQEEFLLESAGAPGMSGGPVFVERDSELRLLGLYTGLVYPDHVVERNDRVTALGTCSNLTLCLWGHLPLVLHPSQF